MGVCVCHDLSVHQRIVICVQFFSSRHKKVSRFDEEAGQSGTDQ
ncbi:hypothetical protein HMPREF9061_00940 [Actinomyces sp. oral taxon 181 str. F0379]|nr:hypothetical protein HMPREF9061_00940 [Actinomyces sp. oral taxon 181 str. F0379]